MIDTPTLIVTPRRGGLVAGRPNELEALVRIQAPEPPAGTAARRSPVNLALVIDRSGSMEGRPVEEAKRCARHVIDGLSATDRAAVVIYDHDIHVLVPSLPVADRERFHAAIRTVSSRGTTNLHGGWLAGAGQVSNHLRPNVLSRVILLSDGQANQGLTDTSAIAAQCAELAAAGVTTSTYGLGHSFNEDLMTAMARAGQGQAYYGETAEDLMEPFQTELALLNATCGKAVTLRLEPEPGVKARVLNDVPEVATGAWRLQNLAYGAEASALITVTIPAAAGESVQLLDVAVAYEDLEGRPYELRVPRLELPVVTEAAWRALPEDELVVRRSAEVAAATLQARAREAVARGDWGEVDRLLSEAKALGTRSPWVAEVVRTLEQMAKAKDHARFMKEASYGSRYMTNRLAAVMEPAVPGTGEPAWVRRKSSQGKAS